LFEAIMPLLTRHRLPVLLGGTSNHFPRHVLESVGGWDPWNVTEDADLGIRLARHGWQVHCLASATLEDAPACWRDWFSQRRRWQKGWLQTYFVHMRNPARLWHELGPAGFTSFQIVLGGSLLCGFAHPLAWLWVVSAWCSGTLLPPSAGLEAALWWGGLVNLAAAAVASITLAALVAPHRQRFWTILNCLAAPLYWLPVSAALYSAVWDLLRHPHTWAKTPHRPRTPPDNRTIVRAP
jgi:glycosyltransferase XagB